MAYIDNHGKTTATRQLGKFVIPNNNKFMAFFLSEEMRIAAMGSISTNYPSHKVKNYLVEIRL